MTETVLSLLIAFICGSIYFGAINVGHPIWGVSSGLWLIAAIFHWLTYRLKKGLGD